MPVAVLIGMLFLCLLLMLLTVSEVLPQQEDMPHQLFTVLPLTAEDSIHTLRRRLSELGWQDDFYVGTVILLQMNCTEELNAYCDHLCKRRREICICRPDQLESVIRSLSGARL